MLPLTSFTFLSFSFLTSKRRALDQSSGSQTCLTLSHQRSFYKFKFLGLIPDHRKEDSCRRWRTGIYFLNASQVTVKVSDIWESLKGSAQQALTGKGFPEGALRATQIGTTWDTLNTHLPGSGRAADRRDRIIRLCLGGTQEPAFVTLPVVGCTVKFQNHWFRQDFKANLWLIGKEIMFTHQYKDCLYPTTLTFHCMLQTLLCFKRHVAHRNGKPISPIVLKWPSLVKHSWQFLSAFFECWFMA